MKSAPQFLEPLSLESFFSGYWEKQPLHIERQHSIFKPLLSVESIEELLSTQPVFFPGVQLTQSGKSIDVSAYADAQNQILPIRLFELHNEGATVVISQAQKLLAPLSDLCRECTRYLQMRCQANIYLSAPGNQGFNAHYDTHDVFILQVSGKKTFNFYPSQVELPCPDEKFDPDRLSSEPVDESIVLSAGDTLYIPRGVVHDAIADTDSPSLHITLGVYPVIMRDVLQEAVQLLGETDSRFRQSITEQLVFSKQEVSSHASCNESRQVTSNDHLQLLVGLLGQSLASSEQVNHLQARFQDELALDAQQDCRALYQTRLKSNSVSSRAMQGKFVLRENSLLGYELTGTGVKVRTFGQVLEFEEPVASKVTVLCQQGSLDAEELDSVSVEQRDALIEHLLKVNLIYPE